MSFLTRWRLDLAADLLRHEEMTIGAVAQRVGYSSPYALSTAFKPAKSASPAFTDATEARQAITAPTSVTMAIMMAMTV